MLRYARYPTFSVQMPNTIRTMPKDFTHVIDSPKISPLMISPYRFII
ncbi:MAG: hypothetical protein V1893_00555 [Candidatus Omnitrophota bacterium]